MSILATYSVSNDTADGTLDVSKLSREIVASNSIEAFESITESGDELQVSGASVLNQTALDAVIHAHMAVTFADKKAEKVLAIDARTRAIIAEGFAFDSHRFSLSPQAQTIWLGLISLQAMFSWPVGITDNSDTTYMLEQANIGPFVGTGCGTIAAAIGSGRALKIAANAATTQAELDAVVDGR